MTGKRQKHARLVSLLDAMIDEELAKPEAEQDIAAVGEWNAMIDRLTSGAYRPTAAFAQASLDAYVSFKEAKAEAPYCFMKKLSSASSAKPIYSFAPSSSDPWENGTYYKDMYQGAAKALGTQARLYAYDHGATFA